MREQGCDCDNVQVLMEKYVRLREGMRCPLPPANRPPAIEQRCVHSREPWVPAPAGGTRDDESRRGAAAAEWAPLERRGRWSGFDNAGVEEAGAAFRDSAPADYSSLTTLRSDVCAAMAPLVESIARRYMTPREAGGCSESLEDLISEGYVGLLTAIENYRADRGARFSTYATHRVNGQIRHYLRDRGNRRLIRQPSWLQELAARLWKEEAALEAELGRPATAAELAERMNLQQEAIEELLAHGTGPAIFSLTEGGEEDEPGGGLDVSKIRSHHYVSWQLPVEDRIFLEGLMARLKDLERKVITLFFFQDFSQTEIARTMDISCNYVGYLLRNGLGKLRKLIESDELRDAQLRVTYSPPRTLAGWSGDPGVIDIATGLYNAGYLRSRLTEEVARACRYRREFALVLFRVEPAPPPEETPNDSNGSPPADAGEGGTKAARRRRRGSSRDHSSSPALRGSVPILRSGAAAGSPAGGKTDGSGWLPPELWKELGIALRECLRKADIPARVEDHTLGVVLPHTGRGAAVAAERITKLLAQVAGRPLRCGLAVYPADGRSPDELLHAAEQQLAAAAIPAADAGTVHARVEEPASLSLGPPVRGTGADEGVRRAGARTAPSLSEAV